MAVPEPKIEELLWEASFIDGARNLEYAGVRLLGVKVRKFCLWHRLLLRVLKSPLVNRASVCMWDLRTAVGICQLRYGDCQIRRPWVIPFLIVCKAVVTSLIPFRGKTAEGELTPFQRALRGHVDQFLEYAGNYIHSPEFSVIPPEQNGKPDSRVRGRAPEEFEIAGRLIAWTGWSDQAVWEFPLSKANCYRIFAMRESGVDIDITSAEEKEFQAHLPPSYRHKK